MFIDCTEIFKFERLIDRESYPTAARAAIAAPAAINVIEKRGCEFFSAHIYALKAAPQTPENIQIREC